MLLELINPINVCKPLYSDVWIDLLALTVLILRPFIDCNIRHRWLIMRLESFLWKFAIEYHFSLAAVHCSPQRSVVTSVTM